MNTEVIEQTETQLKEPNDWAVVLFNDDVTPMDFVVQLLMEVFGVEGQSAVDLMVKIHETGQGAAGVYCYGIAEQKLIEAKRFCSTHNQNLRLELQEQ